MFNRELFYGLCEKYGVELSDKHDRPMMMCFIYWIYPTMKSTFY